MLCGEETASVFKDAGATSVKLDGRAATVLDDFADDCQIVGCSLSQYQTRHRLDARPVKLLYRETNLALLWSWGCDQCCLQLLL